MNETFSFVERSNNSKTGPIGLVTASRGTCWKGCPFRHKCYPNGGRLRCHWDKVDRGERGMDFDEVCRRIAAQTYGSTWRWGDAGDLPGCDGRIRRSSLKRIIRANNKKRGYCFTHKPVVDRQPFAVQNRGSIRLANQTTFTINLSAEGWKRADELCDLGIAPVVTVLPSTMPAGWKTSATPVGRRIVRCPAEWAPKEGPRRIQCVNCGGKLGPFCWQQDRDFIVGFTSHGFAAKQVDAIISEIEVFGGEYYAAQGVCV